MYRAPRLLHFCLLIFFIFSGSSLFVQQANAQFESNDSAYPYKSSRDEATYTLKGTVVNSVTGEPISRALVQFGADETPANESPFIHLSTDTDTEATNYAYRERSMLTDREGRFKFEGLPQMRTSLIARKPGFYDPAQLSGDWQPRASGALEVGPDTPPVTLKLVPEAIMVGHVVDANGEPLEGVAIRISSVMRANGRKQLQPVQEEAAQPQSMETNDEGAFRIANLTPGTYYVAAHPSHDQQTSIATKMAYPVTYYPGVPSFSEATPILISSGQKVGLDFTLRAAPIVSVAGIVTGYARGQEADLQFLNQSGDEVSLEKQFDAQTGSFQARVIAGGPCIIKADARDRLDRPLHAELTLNLSANIKNVRVNLAPAPSIPIVVRLETTKSQPDGASPQSKLAGSIPASVSLHPLEFGHPDIAASVEGGPSNPTLVLRNIDAGKYKVEVIPNNVGAGDTAWYVKSVLYSGIDLLQQELTVVPGESATMEIVLRDDSAVLTGTVQSGENEGQVAVLVVPDHAPQNPKMTVSDYGGEFQIDGLAPGDYKVFAFDRLDGLEYANPDVLNEYVSKAAQVSLQANEKTTIRVGLIPRGE
jgi:hypothetical protein